MKKIITLLLTFILTIFCGGCDCGGIPDGPCTMQEDPTFTLNVSAEELWQKVYSRTQTKYAIEIYEENTIEEFNVYTVYSFLDKPEYFLIELKYKAKQVGEKQENYIVPEICPIHNEQEREFNQNRDGTVSTTTFYTKYVHIFGYFNNDMEMRVDFSVYTNNEMPKGVSIWHDEGVLDKKLYYGSNVFAYKDQTTDKIVGWEIDSVNKCKSELKEITTDRFADLSIRKSWALKSSPY